MPLLHGGTRTPVAVDLTPFLTTQAWTMFALGVVGGVLLDSVVLRPLVALWARSLRRRDGQ